MITKQQKFINEHDLYDADENEKYESEEEPEKPHDHKYAHSQKPKAMKKPLQQKNNTS